MKIKIPILIIIPTVLLLLPGCKKDSPYQPDPVTDIEGNTYKTVKIGNQIWMAENLKTTKFSDGKDIPQVTGADEWYNLATSGYCWYKNDAALYKNTYGALYNGYAISAGNLCPDGWHIPGYHEWRVLREFLGDSTKAGGKLKEAGTAHWLSPNKGADNSSGFTALPAGMRYYEGTFSAISSFTSIWSATDVAGDDLWCLYLYSAEAKFFMDHKSMEHGFSVRCLKD